MNTLYLGLNVEELNRISMCSRAKEISDTLESLMKVPVKLKSKINILVHKHELFKMSDRENIVEILTRFNDIIDSLKALDMDLPMLSW